MTTSAQHAQRLLELHHQATPVILPTVWDAWSAETCASLGFSALTIGSHPVADSLGEADGEAMELSDVLNVVRRITDVVDIPVSVDLESGYDTPAEELVHRTLEAGAAGINIEDTVHSMDEMRSPEEHAAYIAAIRAAADAAGTHLVINGRTDAFTTDEDPEAQLKDALHRMRLLEQAGADSLYPVKVPSRDFLERILAAVNTPLNVTAHPVNGAIPEGLSLEELSKLGVKRVSFGPLLQRSLTEAMGEILQPWTPTA
ncbi:isocitrate lyase/phosphoenolpyruvate mutase family protein [Nesterenkonia sp. LB17]|uniref:isocitrate lyase/PEP mutase family protein n=1 Tax=unclassified Nesterenkonia TaxID=2629769 RepID=UPI001F4C9EAF|nr:MULTISPECIES: isocitrate lyase/phosphoenolpyruvate mutase family protein [unclassified Nesterenkonia]MCH8560171.1 isocitrate lyase/phosphoenolpyruvate mutase family protein [Nesterenkonia sp. DZ6]MCH8563827.1 isocitrate lyase/phosphoenolpyruvate mutase family protein [Nesterenkonia sp. YGD6]MCH8565551.1 isocitrate lyase/phosphoenolpyruvate mutase family protein [Nesterenkonia sp. LB17]MCH8571637.1 isocitrate lyase/phosphoenolpyruvate mutase family protein [Nesterenkonia sp. AY15]